MIQYAIAAFVGCFASQVILAETASMPREKWVRYLAAFMLGVLLTLALAWLLTKLVGAFAHVPT